MPSPAITFTPAECINGLLTTDVALLGANDTYAVLSVRVSRKWLAENHHVLRMLSDLATDAD